MSVGLVICSICHRELHQDGPRDAENGWNHCEDKSPRCIGGHSVYPESESDIKGKWCGQDASPRSEKQYVATDGVYASGPVSGPPAGAKLPNWLTNTIRRAQK